MVLRRPERSVECSDSEKKMSACTDQNHAPSLTCVRLEKELFMYYTLHQRLRKIELDFKPDLNLSRQNPIQHDSDLTDSIRHNTSSSDSTSNDSTCIETVLTLSPFPLCRGECQHGFYASGIVWSWIWRWCIMSNRVCQVRVVLNGILPWQV